MKIPLKPLVAVAVLALVSCKGKKKDDAPDAAFFPVLSFLQSQVADVDTSVYRIIKIVRLDSTADTTYLRREDFRKEAKDFLSIPDISSDKMKDEYVETKMYDPDLEQVVLNYMPKENSDEEIRRQEVMIKPDAGGDKVKTLFIDQLKDEEDSTVQKIMLWQPNRRFRITTLVKKPNTPEKKITTEVIWNDFAPAN